MNSKRKSFSLCNLLLPLVVQWALGAGHWALVSAQTPDVNLTALARLVAGPGPAFDQTARLVHWINDSLTWSATDYVRRTPREILARRQGNCADLASVLHILLDSLEIPSRWIREINVQPGQTPRRQETAEQMVAQRGNTYSVFGLQHNDHVWLEVWNEANGTWFPADPAYGVVGFKEWLPARLALADRPLPRVPAVVPIAADMRVPFVVVAQATRGLVFDEDRTEFYLIDEFNWLYGGKLEQLPAWTDWVVAVRSVAPHARAAFEGKENLHQQTEQIGHLKQVYDALAAQASARKMRWR
jgi:Transglutaminase-like superfamily